jgi:excisionase family DNA binding protein
MARTLSYPPPYQDIATLSAHTTLAVRTIEIWVREGKLPAPKVRGGKRLWKWKEVEQYLDGDSYKVPSYEDEIERVGSYGRAPTRGR